MSSPSPPTVPTIRIRPPSPTVSVITVPRPGTTVLRQSAIGQSPTVLRSSLRRPTVTRSASVTIVEDDRVRVTATTRFNSEREVLDQLQSLLHLSSDASVLTRVRSLSALEQEYCAELVKTHEKQKALDRVLADARQAAAQQRLRNRIDCKDRELDCLQRRAARLDAFNRDVLARVAIRTAAHSGKVSSRIKTLLQPSYDSHAWYAEKRILRARIEQQHKQIRDLERQLRDARTIRPIPRRGQSMGYR